MSGWEYGLQHGARPYQRHCGGALPERGAPHDGCPSAKDVVRDHTKPVAQKSHLVLRDPSDPTIATLGSVLMQGALFLCTE
jgi:hypothetical protein